uniref:Rx N-terminal domain-containing protein n=1 Tax=Opuntia streptacantha TaxID=393608 RepID=A0A7C9ARV1_OPUST
MALEFVSGLVLSPLLQEVVDRMKAVAADTINLVHNSDIEKELKNLEATDGKALRALANIDGWDLIREDPLGEQLADIRRACYDAEDYTEHLRMRSSARLRMPTFCAHFSPEWSPHISSTTCKLICII